jgi:putative ABC transport system permease protein
MTWITNGLKWVRAMARSRSLQGGLDEEFRFHLDQQTEKNRRAGMSAGEARRQALIQFGGIEGIKERTRDEIRPPILEQSIRDVGYGLRVLRQAPAFSVAALITLALGIGANATLFSIVRAVLLRPLPYPESDRLVWVGATRSDLPFSSSKPGAISYQNFADWRTQQTAFDAIGAYEPEGGSPGAFLIGDEPVRMEIQRMSADAFAALRVAPILGRAFNNDEDRRGGTPSVVLSYRAWQAHFGGRSVVGHPVTMNGVVHTIHGVMPPGFSFPYRDIDAWLPLGSIPVPRRGAHDLAAVARLKPGMTLEQARAEMTAIAARLEQAYPDTNKGWKARVEPLMDVVVGDIRGRLWILFAAVATVLLIACANVANLLLARASTRRQELAVRVALGASRGRLLRQLLSESLLLSFMGTGLALLLAKGGLTAFIALAGDSIPRAGEIRLDAGVLGFAICLAVVTGLAFGLAPAWSSGKDAIHESIRAGGRGATGERRRMRQGLIVAEVALTLVLLTAAGLLLRSFYRLNAVNPGFNTEHLVSFDLTLPGVKYRTTEVRSRFFESLLDKLRALPGVEDVGITSRLPLAQKNGRLFPYSVEGRPRPVDSPLDSMELLMSSPGYFRVMGIELRRGRLFGEQDGPNTDRVVVIDDQLANRNWPNADPIGRIVRLETGPGDSRSLTVIGVVARVKLGSLSEQDGFGQAYLSFKQRADINASVVLKTRVTPTALANSIREHVRSVDPAQPVHNMRTISDVRNRSMATERLSLILLSVFALVALAVSVSGLYGVLAYSVARRRREIGVRTALGAQPRDVLRLVLGEGMQLAATGILLGIGASFWLTRWLAHLLFETRPLDPATFSTVALLLLAVAFAACWIPAHAAATVAPTQALREE